MAIEGLKIIGESINDSVPSTKKLFDANDMEGILNLARSQDAGGAAYIDVNVGRRSPAMMADLVKRVQEVTAKPISIDTPDLAVAEAGLQAYDPACAGGARPVLNSISALRQEMFGLLKVRPFNPILLISERVESGRNESNRTAGQVHATARSLARAARDCGHGVENSHIIFDPGIAPIGSDMDGLFKMVLDSMALISQDPELAGVHFSVGLTNFTHMLPPKRADGSSVKSALESAFLTKAMPLGLDMIVGSVKRKYELLPADHPAMVCLDEVMKLDDIEAIERVKEFYSA